MRRWHTRGPVRVSSKLGLGPRHCGAADLGRTNGRRGGSDRWGRTPNPLGAPVTSDSRVRSSRCCGRQMRRVERNPSCGRGRDGVVSTEPEEQGQKSPERENRKRRSLNLTCTRLHSRPSSPAAAAEGAWNSEPANAAAVRCSEWFGPTPSPTARPRRRIRWPRRTNAPPAAPCPGR